MLPFRIIPALRSSDPVTLEQCHAAMIDEGASLNFGDGRPHLLFSDLGEAEKARHRLIQRLPGSEQIWTTMKEVGHFSE